MADLYVQAPPGELLYTFDWSAEVPTGQSITGVTYTMPSPLTSFGDAPDFANKKSTIGIKGIVHGGRYQVDALATLSNSEKVSKSLIVRGLAGA